MLTFKTRRSAIVIMTMTVTMVRHPIVMDRPRAMQHSRVHESIDEPPGEPWSLEGQSTLKWSENPASLHSQLYRYRLGPGIGKRSQRSGHACSYLIDGPRAVLLVFSSPLKK